MAAEQEQVQGRRLGEKHEKSAATHDAHAGRQQCRSWQTTACGPHPACEPRVVSLYISFKWLKNLRKYSRI